MEASGSLTEIIKKKDLNVGGGEGIQLYCPLKD